MRQRTAAPGASLLDDGRCRFRVWAPRAARVDVRLLGPRERILQLQPQENGWFEAVLDEVERYSLYYFRLDGKADRPDPASRLQPQGVHGPSQVTANDFAWSDGAWRGLPLADYVLYELHVGTFTPQGTFDAVIEHLEDLAELGVTAIELMPVAEFPGARNWGYDGVCPYAPHHAYGGADGLKRLVDAAHARRLAVVLDVVYNHLGPEGDYLAEFGPYFTAAHHTPWGPAVNFDGRQCDDVRRYFIDNALYWIDEFHIDGLRLDAVQTIFDQRQTHFLSELASAVAGLAVRSGRFVHLIAETNQNDPRLIAPLDEEGLGLAGQWLDDFCHSIHALATGERHAHCVDFGSLDELAKAYREGFVLAGQFSRYRGCKHGATSAGLDPRRFVAFSQNHDQVGNRPGAERLGHLLDWESQKLVAAATILSPYVPLVFMGQEYGETAPFYFFTSYGDARLAQAARTGRERWFREVGWPGDPPDPQAVGTFERSRLDHSLRRSGRHRTLWEFYRQLFALRRAMPAIRLAERSASRVQTFAERQVLASIRSHGESEICVLLNFGPQCRLTFAELEISGERNAALDSADSLWDGPGSLAPSAIGQSDVVAMQPKSCLLLVKCK